MNDEDVIAWAFQQNYHADKMNASIHCAQVRFSPLTFRLAERLAVRNWVQEGLDEVLEAIGRYAEDTGR